MFDKTKELIGKNIKSNIEVKDYIRDAKELGNRQLENSKGSSVSNDVSKEEFLNRYKNLYFVMLGLSLSPFILILILIFNFSVGNLITILLTFVLISMFYVKYAFIAWRARFVFKNWDKREEEFEFILQDFLDDVLSEPVNLLPVRLNND